jgi:serine protease inhibitor
MSNPDQHARTGPRRPRAENEAAVCGRHDGVVFAVGKTPDFQADHPFLFLIRETRNGSVLFLGRINDPTK